MLVANWFNKESYSLMEIIDLTSSADNDHLIVNQSHPKYKHIKISNYKLIGGIKTIALNFIESDECYCLSKCGSRCVNRLLQIECFSKKQSLDSNCAIVVLVQIEISLIESIYL